MQHAACSSDSNAGSALAGAEGHPPGTRPAALSHMPRLQPCCCRSARAPGGGASSAHPACGMCMHAGILGLMRGRMLMALVSETGHPPRHSEADTGIIDGSKGVPHLCALHPDDPRPFGGACIAGAAGATFSRRSRHHYSTQPASCHSPATPPSMLINLGSSAAITLCGLL